MDAAPGFRSRSVHTVGGLAAVRVNHADVQATPVPDFSLDLAALPRLRLRRMLAADVFEDRGLEVTSSLAVTVEEQIERVHAALT